MPEERWRCFVAVPIGEQLRDQLSEYVAVLRQSSWADAWRWTDPQSWHITLAFLGAISPSTVPSIVDRVREVAGRHRPFTVRTTGLGAFPSTRRPRVLWYGISDESALLKCIAAQMRFTLGVERTEQFRGHLTLARARGGHDDVNRLFPERFSQFQSGLITIDRVALYRSNPGPGPLRYAVLHDIALVRSA